MAISFRCACGKKLSAKDELAGRSVRCPACSTVLKIPVPEVEPTEEPEDAYALQETFTPAPAGLPQTEGPDTTRQSSGRSVNSFQGGSSAFKLPPEEGNASPREYLYLGLSLALIPLMISFLAPKETSIETRLKAAMDHAGSETISRIKALETREDAGLDDLLEVLPEGKLDATAHLPRATWAHWVYGAIAAAAFWVFTLLLFPGEKRTPHHLLLVGLFTGTVGILLLLGFQYAASATQGVWVRGRGVVLVIFYLIKFIGWSYASAEDPSSNLLLSFVGFTCGVGLCEELCKALPLLWHYRNEARMGWRGAALWGLASGVGFGVAEGIMYSSRYYNGISPLNMYVIRFVSCVALHAIWSASVGIATWRRQETIQGDLDWTNFALAVIQILAVPMVLHGLYDTLLKKDLDLWALAVGVATFAWFAIQVEMARGSETDARGAKRTALAS
jgi:protease PrsW